MHTNIVKFLRIQKGLFSKSLFCGFQGRATPAGNNGFVHTNNVKFLARSRSCFFQKVAPCGFQGKALTVCASYNIRRKPYVFLFGGGNTSQTPKFSPAKPPPTLAPPHFLFSKEYSIMGAPRRSFTAKIVQQKPCFDIK